MIALKDFRYHDFARGQSIQVTAGQSVSAEDLGRNKCDVEKFVRTKFVAPTEGEGFGEVLVIKRPRARSKARRVA